MSYWKNCMAAALASLVVLIPGMHVLEAEPEQAVGTGASVGVSSISRTGAAAVTLADGTMLITGGLDPDGTATDAVVIYDPNANAFIPAGSLTAARAGHTATLLADGQVLITGGVVAANVSSDIELFDPSTGASTIIASLWQARSEHAAARLGDDTVVIIGGSTNDDVRLHSGEQ